MILKAVESVPQEKRRSKHKLLDFIEEFENSKLKVAKVDFNDTDYKKPLYCYKSLYNAVRYYKRKGIKVYLRGEEVYLKKVSL